MAEREFECIQRQLVSLRRENRFLKVGLIFCLVLSTLPYLTGFQPTVIRASKVVTERIEFVSGGKTVASIGVHPNKLGLVIEDGNAKRLVFLGKGLFGGLVGVYNRDGQLVVLILSSISGGTVGVINKDGKPVAGIAAAEKGGQIQVSNNDGEMVVAIGITGVGGRIEVSNNDGKLVWHTP
jgi:hypothetical protein